MSSTLVAAHLLRVRKTLTLSRLPGTAVRHSAAETQDPCVLVIPRSGGPRDPYLVVLTGIHQAWRNDSSQLATVDVDVHARACLDTSQETASQEMADVLVCPGYWPCRPSHVSSKLTACLLDRFPGCEVLAAPHRRGCRLETRDGRTVAVTVSPMSRVAEAVAKPSVYGSVLHCWLIAGISLSTVQEAVVIAGYCDATTGTILRLYATARMHIEVAARPGRRGRPSCRRPHSGAHPGRSPFRPRTDPL